MDQATANLELARSWFAAMNVRDAAAMGALCSPDVSVLEVAEREMRKGRDYLVWAYEDLFTGYPDCTADVLNELASDDQVLVEVQWKGTNTGEFRGEPPSGGSNDLRIAYVLRVSEGAIAAITEYYDMATVVAQLEATAPQ